MADVFDPAKRSEVMARIRSQGNRDTELALMTLFRRLGITGWRRQHEIRGSKSEAHGPKSGARGPKLEGGRAGRERPPFRVRPDFVFPDRRIAVFVDGCFWHGCPEHAVKPRTRAAFWRRKLATNRERDRRVNRELRRAGWRVLRIWEHELTQKREARLKARLRRWFGPLPADGRTRQGPAATGAGQGVSRRLL